MKRILVCATLIGLVTIACSQLATAPIHNSQPLAETSSAIALTPNLPAPDILVKTAESTPVTPPEPTDTPLPPASTIEASDNDVQPAGLGMDAKCGQTFIARVSQPPEITKDLFEHHARGTFLIVILEMQNQSLKEILS